MFRYFYLLTVLTLVCGACSGSDNSEQSAKDLTDSEQVVQPIDTDTASAKNDTSLPQTTPIYLALTVHLEGWNAEKKNIFEQYSQRIREYAQLANNYGAHLSWEAQNIVKPSSIFGDNVLGELIDVNGDTVGLHADIGGPVNNGPDWTDATFQAELESMVADMKDLGIEPESVSGICASVDWVTAAQNSGFTTVSGIVDYCLKSLPIDQQSDEVKACENPGQCHGTYPKDAVAKLHPWRAKDGATWTTHDPDGGLLIVPTHGSMVCLDENATDEDSHTQCSFDAKDIEQAMSMVQESLALVDPDQLNTMVFVWSFGEALDVDLFESFFQQIKVLVDEGKIVWTSVDAIHSKYNEMAGTIPNTPPPTKDLSTQQVSIVLHADPQGELVCQTPDNNHWDKLVEVVAAADARDHKITILMSADWAECVSADSNRLDLVASWLISGHQLGYHHHDCSHANPDGYRADNVSNCTTPPCSTCKGKLKGTAAESFSKVKSLEALLINAGVDAEAASIDTANMGPEQWCKSKQQCFRQHEWDPRLIFGMEPISDTPIGPDASYFFLTSPTCRTYSDGIEVIDVLVMGHAQLDIASFASIFPSQNYQNIEAELDLLASGTLSEGPANMGIVFHPREYTDTPRDNTSIAADDKSYIDAIFDLMVTKGFHSVPVRDVLNAQQISCP